MSYDEILLHVQLHSKLLLFDKTNYSMIQTPTVFDLGE